MKVLIAYWLMRAFGDRISLAPRDHLICPHRHNLGANTKFDKPSLGTRIDNGPGYTLT